MPSNTQAASERPEFAALLREAHLTTKLEPFDAPPPGSLCLHRPVTSTDVAVWLLPGPGTHGNPPIWVVTGETRVTVAEGWDPQVWCDLMAVCGKYLSNDDIRAAMKARES